MIDYHKYINALRKCAREHDNDRTSMGHIIVSDLCRDTANLLEELERELKTGYWEWLTENKYRCSNCKHETRVDECMSKPMYDFCPFCRARMESEEYK